MGQQIDPYKSLKGKAALYMFDHGIDLYRVPGTEQEAFERLKKMFPDKYGDVEARQREATRSKVLQLREEEGLDDQAIVDYFIAQGAKYAKIGDSRSRDIDQLQSMRDKKRAKKKKPTVPSSQPQSAPLSEQKVDSPNEQLSSPQPKEGNVEFEVQDKEKSEDKEKAKLKAKEAKKAYIKAKAEAKENKLKAKAEADKIKQLQKEKKAEAKALKKKEKQDAKAAKNAAKAAAAAATAATSATALITTGTNDITTSPAFPSSNTLEPSSTQQTITNNQKDDDNQEENI